MTEGYRITLVPTQIGLRWEIWDEAGFVIGGWGLPRLIKMLEGIERANPMP